MKFKPDVRDLSQDKVNDIPLGNDNGELMEDDLNDDEEPTEDVDVKDENIDKDSFEKATEDNMENTDALENESETQFEQPDSADLASLDSAYVFYLSRL